MTTKHIIGLLACVVFGLFFLFYVGRIAYKNGAKYSVNNESVSEVQQVKLTGTAEYEVPFTSEHDVIQGLSFLFHYDQLSSLNIYYYLTDAETGAELASGSGNQDMLYASDYSNFAFLAPVTGVKGRALVAHLSITGLYEHELLLSVTKDESGHDIPLMKVTVAGKSRFMTAFIVIFLLLLVAVVWAYLTGVLGAKPETVYLGLAVLVATAFLIMLPTGVAPDELTHIGNAYKLSDTLTRDTSDTAGMLWMRKCDADHAYISKDVHQQALEAYYQGLADEDPNTEMVLAEATTTGDPSRMYIFSGLGITLGRQFHFNSAWTFLLARIMNVIFFIVLVYFAIRLIPFGKFAVMVWALLPITLQQACSFSYDAFVNPLCAFIVALTLHLLFDSEKQHRTAKTVILIIASLVLLPCKQYALSPIALFPLLLLGEAYRERRPKIREHLEERVKHYKAVKCIVIAALALMLLGACAVAVHILTKPEHMVGASISYEGTFGESLANCYSLGGLIAHPKDLINLLLNTFWQKGDTLLRQMLGGELGWTNLYLPWACCICSAILLIFAAIRRNDEETELALRHKIWIWIVSFLVFGFTVAGMLLHWTPNTSKFIVGIQGRYFLPFLLPLILTIRTKRTATTRAADRIIPVILSLNMTVMITAYFLAVV